MLVVRANKTARIPVRLLNATGGTVTGITPTELNDGTQNNITVVQNDGTVLSRAMTAGVTWFEIDAAKAPGLYHVVVDAADLDQLGTVQLAINPNDGEFVNTIASFMVEEYHIASQVARNSWKIETSGPDAGRLVVYDDDGVTALVKFDLKDALGNANIASIFERTKV